MAASSGLGDCCISGKLHTGTPVGHEEKVGELDCYVTAGEGASKEHSIVILTDIFGWKLPNTRLAADEYAKKGKFTVYVPDVLEGDGLPIEFLQDVEPPLETQKQLSVLDKGAKTAKVGVTLPPWLIKHREAVAKPIIEKFIQDVKRIPGTSRIGVIGYCWGGRYALLMAHENQPVDAVFAAHPSLVAIPADFDPIVKPVSLAVGDKDSLLSNDDVQKIRDILDKKSIPSEVQVYANQIHGFALRGDYSSEHDKVAQDEAANQAVNWFQKHFSG